MAEQRDQVEVDIETHVVVGMVDLQQLSQNILLILQGSRGIFYLLLPVILSFIGPINTESMEDSSTQVSDSSESFKGEKKAL